MTYLFQSILNGILAGCIYALFAMGLTLIYGVLNFINFAHGEIIMWSAYFLFLLMGKPFELPLAVALPPSLFLAALLGMGMDRAVFRPLRQANRLTLLIAALGLSFFLRNGAQLFWGAEIRTYGFEVKRGLRFLGISLTINQVAIILTSLLCVLLVYLLFYRSRLGKLMRAVQTTGTCQSCGYRFKEGHQDRLGDGLDPGRAAGRLFRYGYPRVRRDHQDRFPERSLVNQGTDGTSGHPNSHLRHSICYASSLSHSGYGIGRPYFFHPEDDLTQSLWLRQKAIREDELAAESLGKNVFRFRVKSFVIAHLRRIGWNTRCHYTTFISPGDFTLLETILVLLIVVLGGKGTEWGPVWGLLSSSFFRNQVIDEIYETIRKTNSEGIPFLIVEQNARKALSMAHRAYVLDLGKKRLEDTGEGLLNNEEVKRLYLGG